MPELIFATRGQAEALAAQESVAQKARDMKAEFESGAKSVGAWDASMTRLKSSSESALRSIKTEQEKIADQIAIIQERQEKGIGVTEENDQAIQRLRQKWIDLDEATLKQAEALENVRAEHVRLKSSAESALRSIQSESDRVREKIEDVHAAMEAGLIPEDKIDEAKAGLEKLKDQLQAINEQEFSAVNKEVEGIGDKAANTGDRIKAIFTKAFDPTQFIKVGVSFVGVNAAIGAVKAKLEDLQNYADHVADDQYRRLDEIETNVAEKLGVEKKDITSGKADWRAVAQAMTPDELRQYTNLKQRREIAETMKEQTYRVNTEGDNRVLSRTEYEQLNRFLESIGEGSKMDMLGPFGTTTETSEVKALLKQIQDDKIRELKYRAGPGRGPNDAFDRPTAGERLILQALERNIRVLEKLELGPPTVSYE